MHDRKNSLIKVHKKGTDMDVLILKTGLCAMTGRTDGSSDSGHYLAVAVRINRVNIAETILF